MQLKLDMKKLEWGGAITGSIGTLLIASNIGMGYVAFLFYAASNSLWITYAHITRQKGMLMMNGVFAATTVLGLINYA